MIKEEKIKRSKKTAKASDTPHYEQVPFEVPASWAWTTLGEMFTLQAGQNITAKDIFTKKDIGHCYPCYGGNGCRGYVSNYNRDGHFPLIGRQGALCGNINEANGQFYATEHAVVVDTYCETNVDWAIYALSHLNLNQYATSTAQPGLSVSTINEVLLPVPPVEEQLRIAQKIHEYFTLIDQIEQGKADLQTAIKQIKSKILDLAIHGKLVPQDPNDEPASELLKRINPQAKITCDNGHDRKLPQGWCSCSYENIFSDISSKPFQILQSQIQSTGDHPVVSQSMKFIEGFSDSKNVFKSNTPCIIFGDHTRNVKYVDFDFIVGADGVKILCPKVNVKWAYYAILYVSLHIENRGYGRHFGQIMKFKYALPPLAEQQRIVQKIEEIFSTLDNIQQSLEV